MMAAASVAALSLVLSEEEEPRLPLRLLPRLLPKAGAACGILAGAADGS